MGQLMERCITDPDTGMLFLEVEAGAVTPKVGPFEPEDRKKKKIRPQSADPSTPKKKKKKKDKDESRSQSEPRPSEDKKKTRNRRNQAVPNRQSRPRKANLILLHLVKAQHQ